MERGTADEVDEIFMKSAGLAPGEGERLFVKFSKEALYDQLSTEGGELEERQAEKWLREHPEDSRVADVKKQLENIHRRGPITLEAAGRPLYRDAEFIRIMIPGERDTVVYREMEMDKRNPMSDFNRFRKQYTQWKQENDEAAIIGTPLSTVTEIVPPILSKAHVEELKYWHIHSVEQLANMADAIVAKFPGMTSLKQKAQKYLDSAKAAVPTAHLRVELDKRDTEIAALKKALDDQGAEIKRLQVDTKRR